MSHESARHDPRLQTQLLASIPDIPRYVYVRALLLDPASVVVGSLQGAVVLSSTGPLAFVHGEPPRDLLSSVLKDDLEVLSLRPIEGLPAGWIWERGTLMTLGADDRFQQVGEAMDPVVPLTRELLEMVPDPLRQELGIAFETGSVMCMVVDGQPVSFASAPLCSESYFDLSVDTLEAFRNRGYARFCASAVMRAEMDKGRNPVWGAKDSNLPSLRAGQSLGFIPREHLWLATKA